MLKVKELLSKILDALKVDYVVEQQVRANSGAWSYRKWKSGRVECWMALATTGTWAPWGSVYSHDIPAQNLPFTFDTYYHFAVAKCAGGNSVAGINSSGGNSTTTPGITLMRGTNLSGSQNFVSWYYTVGTVSS